MVPFDLTWECAEVVAINPPIAVLHRNSSGGADGQVAVTVPDGWSIEGARCLGEQTSLIAKLPDDSGAIRRVVVASTAAFAWDAKSAGDVFEIEIDLKSDRGEHHSARFRAVIGLD